MFTVSDVGSLTPAMVLIRTVQIMCLLLTTTMPRFTTQVRSASYDELWRDITAPSLHTA
jgi:hypothetical protein